MGSPSEEPRRMVCSGTSSDDVECPSCEASMDLTDVQIDDCLKEGFDFECPKCGAKLEIAAVDWSPTIWLIVPPATSEPQP